MLMGYYPPTFTTDSESTLPHPSAFSGSVVVYGGTLAAAQALTALLDRGVPGGRIFLLLPPEGGGGGGVGEEEEALQAALGPSSALQAKELLSGLIPGAPQWQQGGATAAAAGGATAAAAAAPPPALLPAVSVATVLQASGVRTLCNMHIVAAEEGQEGGGALTVTLLQDAPGGEGGRARHVVIKPALVLCCNAGEVQESFFTAVNDCGIVFDGRLVVDEHYCATDPAVFGGGDAAKFSRRLRNPTPLSEYSAPEVGAAVAGSVLRSLGLAASGDAPPAALQRARSTRCMLPGGFLYLRAKVAAYEMGGSGKEVVTDRREAQGTQVMHT